MNHEGTKSRRSSRRDQPLRAFVPSWFILFLCAHLCLTGCAQQRAPLDVRKLGAIGDGATKDTAAFQKALDDCAAHGGGEVVVPAGQYQIGSIEVKSNTTLRLDKDAKIVGSPDLEDYPIIKARWEGRWVDAHRALISARDANHIAIVGPGTIAANPALGGRKMPRQPCVIEPINCNDVRLEGFFATQQRMWTIHPTCCTNLVAKNLNIRSDGGNGDGIDIDSCAHVRIDNCDIDSGDDCISLKSGRGMEGYRQAKPTEDVTISNCTLGGKLFACIGIGSETSGGIRNVRIEHCTFTHTNSDAIYIKSRPGRGAFIEDISATDLNVLQARRGFLRINLLNSGIQDPEPVPGDEGIPSAANYRFENVTVTHCDRLVEANAISPAKPLNGLTITNVKGDCQKGIVLANINHVDLKAIDVSGISGPLLTIWNVHGEGLEGAATSEPTTIPAK